ncbi:MAG: hypothetical protein WA936_05150 [Erythrobacter sp.]|uniref:helix-turn-helix transcriptional regulator n=1 Tax=Erythrobacter sp. TaxID=1042 RepID=UPI003C75A784
MASIGPYIRQEIIPASISVSEAARLLKVGRPALSNLLNGKASLSKAMAFKLQRTFEADAAELLRMQAELEEKAATRKKAKSGASGYLQITASDIENWADTKRVSSRSTLPVLVRRLIHATTDGLSELDFHGDEEADRKGWDGEVSTEVASEKVPLGKSGWELSCSNRLSQKPTTDIDDRENALDKDERNQTSFVFVTSRRWAGKESWAKKRKASGAWKDVRAYDADDLAQWLEQSVATQIWFAEQIGRPVEGIRSLGQCWNEWSLACVPELPAKLFEGTTGLHGNVLNGWLNDTGGRPLVVTADSVAEALAFLSVALPTTEADRALVASTNDALRKISSAVVEDLIIIDDPELEAAAGPLFRSHRLVIVRPKTSVENDANIALDQIEYESFSQALAEMGYGHEDVSSFTAQSARSATILRRLFAEAPELKRPPWAGKDANATRKLLPILFAGAWVSSNKTDCEIVEQLACKTYDEVERDLADLAAMADAPVWSIGTYRGITCRRDALFAAHEAIVEKDILEFLEWAKIILSEDDPALDLEPGERWSAAIFQKKREISGALHHAIGEMLVLLSVYGNQLFKNRIPHVVSHVERTVRELMSTNTSRELLSLAPEFSHLAEAAPDAFLDCLATDLDRDEPQVLSLLRSVEAGSMDSPDRTSLLWALELLAWDEAYYLRVVCILAKLSLTEINDNWVNKPEVSLESLVSCWHPETTVEVDGRIQALQIIMRDCPAVGWRICLLQVDTGHRFASPNNRPTYRPIGLHGSRRVTHGEIWQVVDASWTLLLSAPSYTAQMIADLVQKIGWDDAPAEHSSKFVTLLEDWSQTASDKDRALVVRALRTAGFSPDREVREGDSHLEIELRKIAARLQPMDLVEKHQWLFAESFVPESRAELLDEGFDYKKREEWISSRRNAAALEVYEEEGIDGIFQILEAGNASYALGWHLAKGLRDDAVSSTIIGLLQRRTDSNILKVRSAITGLLFKHGDDGLCELAEAAIGALPGNRDERDELLMEILLACPFEPFVWDMIERSYEDDAAEYWKRVVPVPWARSAAESSRVIDRLLKAKRARAAFAAIRYKVEEIDARAVARVLEALNAGSEEEPGTYPIDGYAIESALAHVHEKRAMSVDELAQLEYVFIDALRHSKYGIPNFERRVAENPASFVELVVLLYKRKDGGEDPKQFRLPDNANVSSIVHNVYSILEKVARTPGSSDDGTIKVDVLVNWVREARRMLIELSREGVGDQCIGQLLGKCPSGTDGIWPHEAVRMALERVGNEEVLSGMSLAVYNSRGAVWRGPGGDQERALAEKYDGWARAVAPQYPVTAKMLRSIAEHYKHDARWHDTDENVRKRLGRH